MGAPDEFPWRLAVGIVVVIVLGSLLVGSVVGALT